MAAGRAVLTMTNTTDDCTSSANPVVVRLVDIFEELTTTLRRAIAGIVALEASLLLPRQRGDWVGRAAPPVAVRTAPGRSRLPLWLLTRRLRR